MAERALRIVAGDRRAMGSLMRDLEDKRSGAQAELIELAGSRLELASPLVVGVTGAPGAGKSTLVDALLSAWRAAGKRVGVIAVDPSSPVHGGAILGDRIRMQRHATDDGVFIRSVASRGAAGGLSEVVHDMVAVFGCGGFPIVIIETMGVGQSEIDVTLEADVTVVVVVPGLGDGIQALKAGLLEMADILVVNKSDRPGADAVTRDLESMLELRRVTSVSPAAMTDPPIMQTVATSGQGVDPLRAAVESLLASRLPSRHLRRQRRARAAIVSAATAQLATALGRILDSDPGGRAVLEQVANRRLDANDAAEALMAGIRAQY
jgi:LAO/AO transport system kinase